MQRRDLLRLGGIGIAGGLLPLGASGWAATGASGRRIIVVFLRGAVDGLNVVVPHGDPGYYAARSSIAVPRDAVIDLDGHFGLHPALDALLPLWREKSLAFIHASGSPDPTRSHFDAQLNIETGTPGVMGTQDGWMNRLLAVLPGPASPTRGVSFGPTLPKIMSGRVAVANMPMGKDAGKPTLLDRPRVASAFDKLYAGQDALSRAYREGQAARQELIGGMAQDMAREMAAADNGAPPPDGFPAAARRFARLIARDGSIEIAFLALGGWDTHVNEGAATGQLANHLKPLGDGLAALRDGLGPAYRETVLLVISEFGRTVRENGNAGTDHGHGNVIWAMGGPVNGGRVYGAWPGLGQGALYEGRDLAVTTDFRLAVAAVLERHLRLKDRALATVLPQMPAGAGRLDGMIKA